MRDSKQHQQQSNCSFHVCSACVDQVSSFSIKNKGGCGALNGLQIVSKQPQRRVKKLASGFEVVLVYSCTEGIKGSGVGFPSSFSFQEKRFMCDGLRGREGKHLLFITK